MDRSASYMARHIAKNMSPQGSPDKCEVQVAYTIGVACPVSLMIDTSRTSKISPDRIAKLVWESFRSEAQAIISYLDLLQTRL